KSATLLCLTHLRRLPDRESGADLAPFAGGHPRREGAGTRNSASDDLVPDPFLAQDARWGARPNVVGHPPWALDAGSLGVRGEVLGGESLAARQGGDDERVDARVVAALGGVAAGQGAQRHGEALVAG
ncbi:MAG: hypothetical protein RJA65_698, partial [Actinomycetota bacterium]